MQGLSDFQIGQTWWDDIDFDDLGFIALMPGPVLDSSPTQNYSQLMQEYFDRRYQALNPCPNKAAMMWYSAPACLRDHDLEIVNVFLNIFSRNMPSFFKLFRDLAITSQTRPDFILAAAAVGGLYCQINGSFEFSKAMYNDSRRLLLASVGNLIPVLRALSDVQDKIRWLVQNESTELRRGYDNSQDCGLISSPSWVLAADIFNSIS